ncbi:MAG1210 family protein [Spiroplasma floricola]|nr:hypothetical protein [Spiroplasma floricola]
MIYEPLKEYETTLKKKFEDTLEEEFDKLVKLSGVDKEANEKLMKSIKSDRKKIAKANDRYQLMKRWKGFLFIFFIVFTIITTTVVLSIFINLSLFIANISLYGKALYLRILIMGIYAIYSFFYLKYFFIKYKKFWKEIDKLKARAEENIEVAWQQMKKLNDLFEWGIPLKLFSKTIDFIKFDNNLTSNKMQYLISRYNLPLKNKTYSTKSLISGEIAKNPFLIWERSFFIMEDITYSGQKNFQYKRNIIEDNGDISYSIDDKVLRAEIVKQIPVFKTEKVVLFMSDLIPNLSYTRKPQNLNSLNLKELEEFINKNKELLEKKAIDSIKENSSFNLMNNTEFESYFNVQNRSNEIEFRRLFTPIAQKNMIELIADLKSGFGDDFTLEKKGMITWIKSDRLKNWYFDQNPVDYTSFSLDSIKQKFFDINRVQFRHMYFTLAPILATPALINTNAKSLIIDSPEVNTNSSPSTHVLESIIYKFLDDNYSFTLFKKESILDLTSIEESGGINISNLNVNSFNRNSTTEFIVKKTPDGDQRNIPIKYKNFLRTVDSFYFHSIVVKDMDNALYLYNIFNNNNWKKIMANNSLMEQNMFFSQNIIGIFSKEKVSLDDLKVFKNKMDYQQTF